MSNTKNRKLEKLIEEAKTTRLNYRNGKIETTAGITSGLAQANLISVPKDWAWDFLLYCQRNPKSCPILDILEAGEFKTVLAKYSDIRSDIPLYRVWENGDLIKEVSNVVDIWSKDLVSFLIGCSFSFEGALEENGIEVRHIKNKTTVPMFITNIKCRSAGKVSGKMVVSMRPILSSRIADAVQISGRFPSVHGSPVHIGNPLEIGIKNINNPDFGEAVNINSDEVPVFWACGVTPQLAVIESKVPFAITHAPGFMFITDIPDFKYHV